MAELAQFDLGSAARVARVVRAVEQEPRRTRPLTFDPVHQSRTRPVFRVCTFTGSWPLGSSKTVTFKNQTNTPNTVSATNLFWPLDDDAPEERDCSIGKDGTAWFLVVPQLFRGDFFTAATTTMQCGIKFQTLPGIALASHSTNTFTMEVQTVPVVTAATITGTGISLQRVSVGVLCNNSASNVLLPFATQDVVTSVTVTNTAVVFGRRSIRGFGAGTASNIELTIATCSTATTS
jgi:hypothetical protein